MELEENQTRLAKLEQYTHLEFMVSPKLLVEYLSMLDDKKIKSIADSYYYNLSQLIPPNMTIYEAVSNKKVKVMAKLISICLSKTKLSAKILHEMQWNRQILMFLLNQVDPRDQPYLEMIKESLNILKVINSEDPNDSYECVSYQGDFSADHYEMLYLWTQYHFLREEYDQVRQLVDSQQLTQIQISLPPQNYYFDLDKLKAMRQLVDVNVNYLSPMTDQAPEDIQSTQKKKTQFKDEETKDKKKKPYPQQRTDMPHLMITPDRIQELIMSNNHRFLQEYMVYLLDESVKLFNKDSLNQLGQIIKQIPQPYRNQNEYRFIEQTFKLCSIDQLSPIQECIYLYESAFPPALKIFSIPNLYKIFISLMIERAEQLRVRVEKDNQSANHADIFSQANVQKRLLLDVQRILIPELLEHPLENLLNVLYLDCSRSVQAIQSSQFANRSVVTIQLTLYVLFGQIHLAHLNALKKKEAKSIQISIARMVLNQLNQIFDILQQEEMMDVFRDFIEGTCVRYYLDTIQAVLMKEENQTETTSFNSCLTFLNSIQDFSLKCDLKPYFLKQAFKREKQLVAVTIRQFHLPIDQIEIKYSKLYKKQIPFYYKQKQHQKSISQTLKYFLGYQAQVQFSKKVFLAEQYILTLLFKNFDELKEDESKRYHIHCLIVSQFVDDKSVTDKAIGEIFKNQLMDFSKQEADFLFDSILITDICRILKSNNAPIEIISFMVNRIRDADSYAFNDLDLKINIQEKYLKRYLDYLRFM